MNGVLNQILERSLSLVFPSQCDLCLSPDRTSLLKGVCDKCYRAVHFIAPPHCHGCGRHVSETGRRCGECASEIFYFDRAFACTVYQGPVRELLHHYKFNDRKHLYRFFVSLLGDFIDQYLDKQSFDTLCSVPLDKKKKRARGFNQAGLLSRKIAQKLGLPDISAALLRLEGQKSQHLLGKNERRKNIEGKFVLKTARLRVPRHVLLIDDILTTGHTASECAKILKQGGAERVTILACARGI